MLTSSIIFVFQGISKENLEKLVLLHERVYKIFSKKKKKEKYGKHRRKIYFSVNSISSIVKMVGKRIDTLKSPDPIKKYLREHKYFSFKEIRKETNFRYLFSLNFLLLLLLIMDYHELFKYVYFRVFLFLFSFIYQTHYVTLGRTERQWNNTREKREHLQT